MRLGEQKGAGMGEGFGRRSVAAAAVAAGLLLGTPAIALADEQAAEVPQQVVAVVATTASTSTVAPVSAPSVADVPAETTSAISAAKTDTADADAKTDEPTQAALADASETTDASDQGAEGEPVLTEAPVATDSAVVPPVSGGAAGASAVTSANVASAPAAQPAPQPAPAKAPAQAPAASDPAARVGDAGYATLAKAFSAAADGQTITLQRDVSDLAEAITVSGKSVTLDGRGHKISRGVGADGKQYTGSVFVVEAGAGLTIQDVTIDGGAPGWYLDWDNPSSKDPYPSYYVNIPIVPGDGDVLGTAPLVVSSGDLTIEKSTFKDAIAERTNGTTGDFINGAFVRADAGSMQIKAGSVFQHGTTRIYKDGWNGAWTEFNGGGAVFIGRGVWASIDGATFEGNASGSEGGAIAAANYKGETLSITNSTFKDNYARWNGGALHSDGRVLTVSNTTFDNNVVGNDGGAIMMGQLYYGSEKLSGSSTFKNVTFTNNRGLATGGQTLGGTICIGGSGEAGTTVTFDDSSITGSQSAGGAFSDYGASIPVIFNRCDLSNNTIGGAFYCQSLYVTLNDCTLTGNSSAYSGGAAELGRDSTFTLNNCTVTGNKAGTVGGGSGGAIMLFSDDGYAPTLTLGKGTVITGNKATGKKNDDGTMSGGRGGAVYATALSSAKNPSSPKIVMEEGSKLYGNTADKAGDDIAVWSGVATSYQLVPGLSMDAETADGFTIDGWYFDTAASRYLRNKSEKLGEPAELTGTSSKDNMIYLKADASTAGLAFDPNAADATGTTAGGTYGLSDASLTLTPNGFKREGYRFVGWTASPHADLRWDETVSPALVRLMALARRAAAAGAFRPDYGDGQTVADPAGAFGAVPGATCTLYAVWQELPVTVSFDGNAGDATGSMDDEEVGYGEGLDLPANGFSRDGYVFKGWATSPDGGVAYADLASVESVPGDRGSTWTLYAVWEEGPEPAPEPAAPSAPPAPRKAAAVAPRHMASALPQTGDPSSAAGLLASLLGGLGAVAGSRRLRRRDK